jgi:hypothetical protein
MDRLIKTRREKQKCPNDTLELLINTHPLIYIWGAPGIGKTWTIRQIIEPCIDLDSDILKSKQATLDMLDRGTSCVYLIDDYESVQDLVGVRELGVVKKMVIIGNHPYKGNLELFQYEFPTKTLNELVDIAKLYGVEDFDIVKKSKGDIRFFIQKISDDKDVFWNPKDFVKSLIGKNGHRDPMKFLGSSIDEHGHVMDIIHDNYIDSGADPCEVLECLSVASIYDDVIYSGNWNLLPYFTIESCIHPARLIGHSIAGDLRPGSNWTKFSSMCMRRKKVRAMCTRVLRRELTIDAIMILRDYFENMNGLELIKDYDLHKCDFDVMAHLCLVRKLKAKTITALKKHCLE